MNDGIEGRHGHKGETGEPGISVETLSDDLRKVIENIQKLDDGYKQIIEAYAEQIQVIKDIASIVEFAESVPNFQMAATARNLSVKDWILQVLQDNIIERTDLPVREQTYKKFQEIATARGVTLAQLCKSPKASTAFESIIKNYQL